MPWSVETFLVEGTVAAVVVTGRDIRSLLRSITDRSY